MRDRKEPLGQALDLFVYAPIGFVFSLRDLVPQLAERGREQVRTAVGLGQLAVDAAVKMRPGSRSARLGSQANPAPSPPTVTRLMSTDPPPLFSAPDPGAADALAIPGYDALSASQVVPRLEGLTVAELEAVRLYEEAQRGRKTVLNRIAQLQAAS